VQAVVGEPGAAVGSLGHVGGEVEHDDPAAVARRDLAHQRVEPLEASRRVLGRNPAPERPGLVELDPVRRGEPDHQRAGPHQPARDRVHGGAETGVVAGVARVTEAVVAGQLALVGVVHREEHQRHVRVALAGALLEELVAPHAARPAALGAAAEAEASPGQGPAALQH